MEGSPSGRRGVLKVEREFEPHRKEAQLLAAAYEELVPVVRRNFVRADSPAKVVEAPRRQATVGA